MNILAGKVAIVTGAGQGIGRGVARALAVEGAAVVIAERNPATGRETRDEIASLGGTARFVECDIVDPASIAACVTETVAAFGGIGILVNNAIAGCPSRPFEEHDDADWSLYVDIGMMGTFRFMKACFPHMKAQGWGRIVNFGSMAGYQAWPDQVAYATVKEAIRTMSKVAAREWGRHGINVNVICPFANSPGWIGYERDYPELARAQLDRAPIRRVGDCEADVGRAAVYLCSPDSAFVTGHTLPVDGGNAIIA